MSIGIFGDSYANSGKYSWVSNFNASNYSVGGSSIDYSYLQFLNNHHKHDTIIFIVTSSARGSIFTSKNNKPKHLAFYQNARMSDLRTIHNDAGINLNSKLEKTIKNEIRKNIDYDSNILYHKAYLDSIEYHRPDANIIFAFDFFGINKGCMFDISMLDYNNLNLDAEYDSRYCHMSNKQNEEFANYIKKHIETDFDIHTTMQNAKEYYTVSQSKEEANWV